MWRTFVCGLFVGAFLAMLVMSLMAVAGDKDHE